MSTHTNNASSSRASGMPRTTLGRTGIEVSALSLGTWGFGNASAPTAMIGDDDNLISVVKEAFAQGICFFDSAESYQNEERLGRVMQGMDVPDDLVIATKFGHGKGFSAEQFVASVEQSMESLGLERIELMMVHDPRGDEDMDVVMGKGGALEGMRKMQDRGLVGSIGVATGSPHPLHRAVDSGEFDAIQFPRLYTLINRAAETSGLLEKAKAKNIGTLAAAPFAGNILATGVRNVETPLYGYWPALPEVVEAVGRMEDRASELGISLPAAALCYAATSPLIDSVVVGVTDAAQLRQNVAALDNDLSRDDLESIAAAGEIDEYYLGGPEFVMPFPPDRPPEAFKNK